MVTARFCPSYGNATVFEDDVKSAQVASEVWLKTILKKHDYEEEILDTEKDPVIVAKHKVGASLTMRILHDASLISITS